eukprot:2351203-Prymnesium_polylepis.1
MSARRQRGAGARRSEVPMPYAVCHIYTTGTQDGRCPIRTSRHASPDHCVGVCMLCGCVCCANMRSDVCASGAP